MHTPRLAAACEACHRPAPTDPPPLSWSAANEGGRRTWTCEGCAREHVRSIEAKLDQAWWVPRQSSTNST